MLTLLIMLAAVAGSSLVIWGIVEQVHPYYSTEARMRRSVEKMKRRHRQALDDFKYEIQRHTRR